VASSERDRAARPAGARENAVERGGTLHLVKAFNVTSTASLTSRGPVRIRRPVDDLPLHDHRRGPAAVEVERVSGLSRSSGTSDQRNVMPML
jgi:hypothetical protein